MKRALALLIVLLLSLPAPALGDGKDFKTSVVASTENAELVKQFGTLTFPDKAIQFQSDAGKTLTIPCSSVTHASYTTKSKALKKVVVPAVAGAIFTMGLSLFALAIRGHGYFLAVDYGSGQQVVFSMGKNVYSQDVNATSACTGKPTEVLK